MRAFYAKDLAERELCSSCGSRPRENQELKLFYIMPSETASEIEEFTASARLFVNSPTSAPRSPSFFPRATGPYALPPLARHSLALERGRSQERGSHQEAAETQGFAFLRAGLTRYVADRSSGGSYGLARDLKPPRRGRALRPGVEGDLSANSSAPSGLRENWISATRERAFDPDAWKVHSPREAAGHRYRSICRRA
jgi:hypothetical protein